MARKKHRGLGRVALVAGVGLLGWYAYKKGAFDPVKEWWASLSGGDSTTPDTTPSTTPSETTPSSSDSGGLWSSIIDWIADAFGGNSQGGSGSGSGTGLSDILDTIDDWFDKKREETTQETLVQQGSKVLGTVAGALTAGSGAATAATVSSGALTPAAAQAAAAAPTVVQGATSVGAAQATSTLSQLGQLGQAGLGTQLTALAMAAVPVFIGTSQAVADVVHTTNVAITKKLQESGVQKPTRSGTAGTYLYDVVLPGNTTTSRVMIGAHDVVYDLSGSKAVKVTNMDAKTIKKRGTRVQTW